MLALTAFFRLLDEIFKLLHARFSFANRNFQVAFQTLAFSWDIEDELAQLLHELRIADSSCAPSMHAVVALRIEVAIGKKSRFLPISQRFSFSIMEQGYDSVFVIDIGLFPYEGILHLVERLLEVFLIFSNQ